MELGAYVLALVGGIVAAISIIKAVRCIRKDMRSKPTPWLGLPWGPG